MKNNQWIPVSQFSMIEELIPQSVLSLIKISKNSDQIMAAIHNPVRTVDDVVRILSVSPDAIVKSIFFKSHDQYVLVCVPGNKKVDVHKVKEFCCYEAVRILPLEEIRNITEIPIGAISPLTYISPPVFIDIQFNTKRYLYMGSGNREVSFMIPIHVIKKLSYLTWGNFSIDDN